MIWLMVNQKTWTKRTESYTFLRVRTFEISSNPKYDRYQRGLTSMVYKFFDKKSSGGVVKPDPNYQLLNELHIRVITNINWLKFYSSFLNKIWGVDLADMQ